MEKFRLIVIGGGAAGFAAAIEADRAGIKTLMINNSTVGIGGTCVNEGCFPTKHLLTVAEHIHSIRKERFEGVIGKVELDFMKIIQEKERLVQSARSNKYEIVLDDLQHVTLLQGNARFISENRIDVEGKEFEGERFIIATGSSSSIPAIPGIEVVPYYTNREILQIASPPESLIVVGGGALGLEFAQMFSRFGSQVTVVEYAHEILPAAEPELNRLLRQYLEEEGIRIETGTGITSLREESGTITAKVESDGNAREITGTALLLSAGRHPNTESIGLEKTGIRLGNRGEIITDEYMKAADVIYAAGDVAGEPMLETVAAKQGNIALRNAFALTEEERVPFESRIVPRAVFTDPQLAQVGMTDAEANRTGVRCRCVTIPLSLVPKAEAIKNTQGAVKMVINAESEEILGIHILAPGGADLIHEGVMIIKNKMKLNEVIDTLHIFPTLSEGTKIAAQAFKRDIKKMTCCVE